MTHIELWNEAFKLGRRAGQKDVCLEILKYDPSFAWKTAREYLSRIPGQKTTEPDDTYEGYGNPRYDE